NIVIIGHSHSPSTTLKRTSNMFAIDAHEEDLQERCSSHEAQSHE
ncbi:25972_t:CDS:1, partial [Gigaspora margarita]